ncbi:hypothetical protein B0H14DRAFT_2632277 [Mycena olivaceomarginata]|nr:hypothetical protein B0H14DRAFT_2632277 [Mycena olivaceomarginata]
MPPTLRLLEGEADDEEGEDASPAYQAREKLYQVQKHLSQIVLDGRIGKKSIALVLTGTDIPFDDKGVEIDLATHITKLTAQIEILKKHIENGHREASSPRAADPPQKQFVGVGKQLAALSVPSDV